MSMIQSDPLLGQEGGAGYTISRSLRFNSSDSAFCSRTFSSAGNRRTWTWAGWVKRSELGDVRYIFSAPDSSGDAIRFGSSSDNKLFVGFFAPATSAYTSISTAAEYRDPSAWLHIVVATDTTQATASDRVKLYVNGVQVTAFSSATYPAQNAEGRINTADLHRLGRPGTDTVAGYLADVFFIDGQALTPSSFTEVSATTGQLIPKAYTGTFTGNSFWLKFADNSAATATTLGKDSSGLGNNWAPNNFSIGGITYSSATNGNTPVYDIQIGPTNDLSGTYVWSNAFDANGSTIGLIGPITFINTKPTWSTSAGVEVMAAGNGITATVNGGTQVACTNGGWTTISTGSSGTLNSIWVYSSTGASYFYGVRVDGVEIAVRRQIDDNKNNDSLTDTPTSYGTDDGLGGSVRGNYCTFNPLEKGSSATLSNGNLDASFSAASLTSSTFGLSSGKWYWEVTVTATNPMIGIVKQGCNLASYPGSDSLGWGYSTADGFKYTGGSGSSYGATATTNDVIGVAFDADNGTLVYYKNGSSQGTAFTGLTSGPYLPAVGRANGTPSVSANFGQRAWAYTPPANYRPLVDTLLPTPVVAKPSTVMDVALYTGTGSSLTVSSLGFSPDLVWLKSRGAGRNHRLTDTVRGATKVLQSDLTSDEATEANGLTAFNSNGFTVGSSYSISSEAWVGWCWDAGTSTVTNTQGSITSQVRANGSAGFSIVTYTGNGTKGATIGHGLGVGPQFVICKRRDAAEGWWVGHVSPGWTTGAYLHVTDGFAATSNDRWWNNTAPTSSVITLGTYPNTNTGTYVCYAFAPVAGYSAFGSYTGNGSTDGPFVFTGMRPRFVLWKSSSYSTSNTGWVMLDATRDTYNPTTKHVLANQSVAESSLSEYIDICSNGFKFRYTDANNNANGQTYIYAAFAESPFQYARAR